jgi:dTMP kinase
MIGKFITFEGPEGSGKSTQAAKLAEHLKAEGQEVIFTREPGGTPVGEAIRNVLQYDSAGDGMTASTEILLFEASRAALMETVIKPALDNGTWVICDRFSDSTTVYQGYGRGYDVDTLLSLNETATQGVEPDLTILLDLEVDESFKRLEKRNSEAGTELDRMEREERSFHERVREGYLEIAARFHSRCYILDGSLDSEVIEEAVWSVVTDRFNGGLNED